MSHNDATRTQRGFLTLAARMFEHGAEAIREARKAWESSDHKEEKRLLEEKDFFLRLYQVLKKRAASWVAEEEVPAKVLLR